MKKREKTSLGKVLESKHYMETISGIQENGIERGNRFSEGMKEMCEAANIIVAIR